VAQKELGFLPKVQSLSSQKMWAVDAVVQPKNPWWSDAPPSCAIYSGGDEGSCSGVSSQGVAEGHCLKNEKSQDLRRFK
jgi:hypothetical protein